MDDTDVKRDYELQLSRYGTEIVNSRHDMTIFIERVRGVETETAVYMIDPGVMEVDAVLYWQTARLAGRMAPENKMHLTNGYDQKYWYDKSPFLPPDKA